MSLNTLNKYRPWVLLALAAGMVALTVWRASSGFPLDDSWIHQAYGRNLGTRGEWALIPGQPSAASTAPLYTVLLAAGYALRVAVYAVDTLAGRGGAVGDGGFSGQLAERLAPERQYAGLITGVFVVLAWHLIWAAASGMETALFAFWTLLLPWLAWREFDDNRNMGTTALLVRGGVFGGAAALAVLTRPEGLGIAGLSGLALLVTWWQRRNMRGLVWWLAGAALSFAVLIAPYLLLNWRLAGSLLPNTSAAKQAQHAPLLALGYPRRVWMMMVPALVGGQVLLLPGAIWLAVKRLRARRNWAFVVVLLAWPVALILLYAARLPAAYQHGRYVIPAIPALLVCGVVGTLDLLRVGRRSLLTRVASRALIIAAAGVTGVMALMGISIYDQDVDIINEEMVASARWIDENLPPDKLLVVHDIGAVAYFAPRPILDVAGLVSPEVVPIINEPEALWALIRERDAAYLMAFPDQIPGITPMTDACA